MGNECVVCEKAFSSDRRLQIHLVKKHSVRSDQNVVDKKYKCNRCEKSYTTRANLLMHERSHIGSKPFECNECGRSFYDENSLINHTSIHTGIKVRVQINLFSLLFPTSLATMMPSMSFVLIKKFNCEDCGKCFTTANILQQHRKKHSMPVRPHKCSDCPAAFYTQNDLRIHFLTHTRERMHLCCQCGKRFSRKTHLNIHLSEFIVVPFHIQAFCWDFMDFFFVFLAGTHSGLKPFQCSICQKSFAISGDLKAHMRVCHNRPCN